MSKETMRLWHQQNHEHDIEYGRAYHAAHKDDPEYKAKACARAKAWREARKNNPEFKAKEKAYRESVKADPEKHIKKLASCKKYYEKVKGTPEFKAKCLAYKRNTKYLDIRFFKWEQVEGYDGWTEHTVVHHRLEDKGYSMDELKAIGAYYKCCPEDLICMSNSEHTKHHHKLRRQNEMR